MANIRLLSLILVLIVPWGLITVRAQQARPERCFDGTNFVPGAQGCADSAGTLTTPGPGGSGVAFCDAFFPTEPVATDVATNSHPCYAPENKQMAARCRRRCKTCCLLPNYGSCEDQDRARDQPAGTPTVMSCDLSQCGVENVAVKVCPRTCGRCVDFLHGRQDTQLCEDKQAPESCVAFKESNMCSTPDAARLCALTCNDPAQNNMQCVEYTRNARATAGQTASGGRAADTNKDQSDDCRPNKRFCRNSVYKDLMKKFCPETCKSAECTDKAENCASWKQNGFCENEFFPIEIRTEECAETCGLC